MTNSDRSVLEGEPRISTTTPLVCLNFKVPLHIRQRFKAYAARRNMSMTDLLLQLLDQEIKN